MSKYIKKRNNILPDLTPMIDVVFLLIIFFMVTTTFNNFGTIDVNLPNADIKNVNENRSIEIIIDSDNKYFISENGKIVPINFNDLENYLKNVKEVSISADKNLKYQTIMDLITEIKKNNIENLGLNFYE